MDVKDRIVVVTGAASGIGRALARACAQAGAARVICADLNGDGAAAVAAEIGPQAVAIQANMGVEAEVGAMIARIETEIGPIDLFCANAGILALGGLEAPDAAWQRSWEVNVMSQVWAARHLVPRMTARGGGYILTTASAAGLLNQVGAAPYGVTKHASVGFSEWLQFTHYDDGIRVSVLCPQAVRSEMTRGHEDGVASLDGMLEPEQVAQDCLEAIAAERFLVLPHPSVLDYMRAKAQDYGKWLGGMRKLNRIFNPK